MDNSKEFLLMLDKAIKQHPEDFENFDRTKNMQDQLQEIYARYIGADGYCALIDFGEWFKEIVELDNLGSDKRIYDTPEQLWLAFVMYEKFNKIWDGKQWIKKND